MEKNTDTGTRPIFKRKRQIGFNLLTLKQDESVFAEIKSCGLHDSKNHGEIEYFDFINLETGELQRMWIDGGLRGALTSIGDPEHAVGMKLEIRKNPKVEATIEIDGKDTKTMVNSYSVWELSH